MVYTAMLNERGGFESDLTITRIAEDTFFILTGSAQATRDADWIGKHIAENEFAALFDVTSAYSIISVMGPKSRELLERVSTDDLSLGGLPFSTTREIDVGYARARAARMSYIGGAGYELCVATDQCVTLYDALHAAGAGLGLAITKSILDLHGSRLSVDSVLGVGTAFHFTLPVAVLEPSNARGAASPAQTRGERHASVY
jgi:4-methylaminobutanoate oxidase (formaldehyde-forming)